jgi:hypothetical protein
MNEEKRTDDCIDCISHVTYLGLDAPLNFGLVLVNLLMLGLVFLQLAFDTRKIIAVLCRLQLLLERQIINHDFQLFEILTFEYCKKKEWVDLLPVSA